MRQAALLLIVLACAASPAFAQVTVDLHALDAVEGVKPRAAERQLRPTHRQTAAKPVARPEATTKPQTAQTTAVPAKPTEPAVSTPTALPPVAAAPPPATLPSGPPATVALAPIPPPAPTEVPPPPPVSSTATSAASSTAAGLRVTFGSGQTDLTPTSAQAILDYVHQAPSGDTTSYNVVAYATGTPEDPSTARRLSLSRALAVRSALIANGVGSTHIYVRALGAQAGDEPADRVDLSVLGGNAPAATPANAAAPPAEPKNQQQ